MLGPARSSSGHHRLHGKGQGGVIRLAADQGEVGVFSKWNISPALPVEKIMG